MDVINTLCLLLSLSVLSAIFLYKFSMWFIAIALAFMNYDATLDEKKREKMIRLSRTDKIWERVVKILELEKGNKNGRHN